CAPTTLCAPLAASTANAPPPCWPRESAASRSLPPSPAPATTAAQPAPCWPCTTASRYTGDPGMVATLQAVQRFTLPLLAIGLTTGLLALIPKVGWLLGFMAFMLAYHYARRTTFLLDLCALMALWILVRLLFMHAGL